MVVIFVCVLVVIGGLPLNIAQRSCMEENALDLINGGNTIVDSIRKRQIFSLLNKPKANT